MVRKIEVIKRPLKEPIPDYPANFPPLQNLHLDMMENKLKLKAGLPLIPLKLTKKRKITTPPNSPTIKENFTHNKENNEHKSAPRKKVTSTDKDLIEALGDDVEIEVGKKRKHVPKTQDEEEDPKEQNHSNVEEEEPEEEERPRKRVSIEMPGDNEEEETEEYEQPRHSEDRGAPEPRENDEEEEEEEEDEDAHLTPEEKEEKDKTEYLIKYDILRRKYKGAEIPDFNRHTSLHTMKVNYDAIVRRIHIDSSLKTYRKYLIGGFFIIEFASTQWFGLDMRGFSKEQFTMMDEYDTLLIELGEKSYNNLGSNLPVEIRLVGFILMQAGIFYITKIVAEKAGESVSSLFKSMRGIDSQQQEQPKHKMRGPSVHADDIREWTS